MSQTELDLQPQISLPDKGVAPPARIALAEPASAPAPARELWAAVQLNAVQGAVDPAALGTLLRRAQAFTPRVAIESPDALLLELAGSQRLFGGLHVLLSALRGAFPRPLRLAMAPTPLAALLLARAGRNCCITSAARLRSRVAPLSLEGLRWPEAQLDRLRCMGVTTVGELLRLPRAGLARRIGPECVRQLDRLVGHSPDPRPSLQPVERFSERIDPDFETCDRERMIAMLKPTLDRLEVFLRARQRGITALRVLLVHRAGAPTMSVVRCVVPEYRAARFAALLAARLEGLPLASPVRRFELAAGRQRPFVASSGGLWQPGEHGGAGQAQLPEFLQTLMARLGDSAVYGLEPVAEHRPERQWRSVWPDPARTATPARIGGKDATASRPLGLWPQPLPLVAEHNNTGAVQALWHEGQALRLVTGPERIESGWWDGGDVARDYYIARASDGRLLWIFRECRALRRWFLHGCFA
jgi:protein ImuB